MLQDQVFSSMDEGGDVAVELYPCGSELMRKWGLILIDSERGGEGLS